MALRQTSFRRILLTHLLLVSIPVLLIGVYVTYRKARSAFLETARQNLTESAVRKADSIYQFIEALQTNLVTASDSVVLKEGSSNDKQRFLEQLATRLPTQIKCVQLTDLETAQLLASTCGDRLIDPAITAYQWTKEQDDLLTKPKEIYVKNKLPSEQTKKEKNAIYQLEVLLAAPVYDNRGQLKYGLSIQSALLHREKVAPGSLSGYPVVLNQAGTILAHPLTERIGRNIQQEADKDRLETIIKNAIASQPDFRHLFSFEKDGVELVAGYSALPSPVTRENNQKWVILAVTPLDNALAPLRGIKEVLFNMVIALLIASFLAILIISKQLARPLEQLRDYVLNKDIHSREQIPQNFNIREFNQLATALKEMIEHLKAWGEEVITSWKEAQNANQLKNEFLATTSHELRTPLNGIIGCIRIIKDGYCDDPEEEREFLQQADNAAVHLLGIINDILDIAKIEAGKLSVSPQPVDLRKILTEVINLQLVEIEKKRLKLNLSEWEPTTTVFVDPAKFKQVLLNVIGNAVKFTDRGSIFISTRTEKAMAIITIKDTGIGIEPNQQNKLFRPFVMIDGSSTRKFGGTGLGLAISKNLIELMGGNIILFSAGPNKGTTVEISVPLIEASILPDNNEYSSTEIISV